MHPLAAQWARQSLELLEEITSGDPAHFEEEAQMLLAYLDLRSRQAATVSLGINLEIVASVFQVALEQHRRER